MSKRGKESTVKEDVAATPEVKLEEQENRGALVPAEVQQYLKRKSEISEEDRREFQLYLNEKALQARSPDPGPQSRKATVDRRTILKVVAGTGVAAETAALAYSWIKGGGSVSDQGLKHAGDRYTEAQR